MKLHRRDLMVLSILAFMAQVWRLSTSAEFFASRAEYWSYAPNVYRLWNQFLLHLHMPGIIGLRSWIALSLVLSLFATWMILDLRTKDNILLFLFLSAGLIASGYLTHCVPMYPLLAYIAKTRDPRLIPFLAFIKEHAVIIAVLFFLVYGTPREQRDALIGGYAALWIYALTVWFIGPVPYHPDGASMFTLFYMIHRLTVGWIWVAQRASIVFIALVLFLPMKKRDYRLLILNAIFVFSFGLWWEFQLWLPVLLMLFAERLTTCRRAEH